MYFLTSLLVELIDLLKVEDGAGPGLRLECPTHGTVRVTVVRLVAEGEGVRFKGYCPRQHCPCVVQSEVIALG